MYPMECISSRQLKEWNLKHVTLHIVILCTLHLALQALCSANGSAAILIHLSEEVTNSFPDVSLGIICMQASAIHIKLYHICSLSWYIRNQNQLFCMNYMIWYWHAYHIAHCMYCIVPGIRYSTGTIYAHVLWHGGTTAVYTAVCTSRRYMEQ